MKREKHRGNFASRGGIEVIDIIRDFGAETDYCFGSALRYFLLAPYRGDEEFDYRSCLSQLEMIYERQPFQYTGLKVNFSWIPHASVIRLQFNRIIGNWCETSLRREFLTAAYYKSFNLEKCIRTVDALIDLASDYEDTIR